MEKYDIAKMLTLSTAHITEDTAKILDNRVSIFASLDAIIVFPKSDYGWFLYIPEYVKDDYGNLPKDLIPCIKLAEKLDCEWLCLDRDGEIEEELPVYNW